VIAPSRGRRRGKPSLPPFFFFFSPAEGSNWPLCGLVAAGHPSEEEGHPSVLFSFPFSSSVSVPPTTRTGPDRPCPPFFFPSFFSEGSVGRIRRRQERLPSSSSFFFSFLPPRTRRRGIQGVSPSTTLPLAVSFLSSFSLFFFFHQLTLARPSGAGEVPGRLSFSFFVEIARLAARERKIVAGGADPPETMGAIASFRCPPPLLFFFFSFFSFFFSLAPPAVGRRSGRSSMPSERTALSFPFSSLSPFFSFDG